MRHGTRLNGNWVFFFHSYWKFVGLRPDIQRAFWVKKSAESSFTRGHAIRINECIDSCLSCLRNSPHDYFTSASMINGVVIFVSRKVWVSTVFEMEVRHQGRRLTCGWFVSLPWSFQKFGQTTTSSIQRKQNATSIQRTLQHNINNKPARQSKFFLTGTAFTIYILWDRFRAKREQLKRLSGLSLERQGQNVALTVLSSSSFHRKIILLFFSTGLKYSSFFWKSNTK